MNQSFSQKLKRLPEELGNGTDLHFGLQSL